MLFHHGTLKSTLSQDCLFFSLNLNDKIIKMEKQKIDDDKKKMVEQKNQEKNFLCTTNFFLESK